MTLCFDFSPSFKEFLCFFIQIAFLVVLFNRYVSVEYFQGKYKQITKFNFENFSVTSKPEIYL